MRRSQGLQGSKLQSFQAIRFKQEIDSMVAKYADAVEKYDFIFPDKVFHDREMLILTKQKIR
jgi:hypothetical protein